MYIITAKRITSGELLKYRQGFCIAEDLGSRLPGSNQFGLTKPARGFRCPTRSLVRPTFVKVTRPSKVPFFGDLLLEFRGELHNIRELIRPLIRTAGIDQHAIGGISSGRTGGRFDRGLRRRGPDAFDDIDTFADVAARGHCPDDIGRVGDIDIVIDHDDEFTAIGAGPRACGLQRGLLGMTGVALLDRDVGLDVARGSPP